MSARVLTDLATHRSSDIAEEWPLPYSYTSSTDNSPPPVVQYLYDQQRLDFVTSVATKAQRILSLGLVCLGSSCKSEREVDAQ